MDEDFYAQIVITVTDQAPLLANPRLARIVMAGMDACDPPGQVWGYVILPDQIRFVVGPGDDSALDAYINQVKAETGARLLDVIRRAEDDSLDVVLRYHPLRDEAIYQVWQAGYHCLKFWSEYKLSNALYEMLQRPVAMGLVAQAEEWPYRWVIG